MDLTKSERLTLLMLCDIYNALKIKSSFNPSIIEKAIITGNMWAIEWEYGDLLSVDATREEAVTFVADVLDMFSLLDFSVKALEPKEFQSLEQQLQKDKRTIESVFHFQGFDGNNEGRYLSIVRMFISMDRFTEFTDAPKNSHMRTAELYKRMLRKFETLRSDIAPPAGLSVENLLEIANERIHPSNR